MRNVTKALVLISILVGGGAVAPPLYAQGGMMQGGQGGMMGDKSTKDDGGMMGMMKMMTQMSQMKDRCNNMMSDSRPNDQWRKNSPSEPQNKG